MPAAENLAFCSPNKTATLRKFLQIEYACLCVEIGPAEQRLSQPGSPGRFLKCPGALHSPADGSQLRGVLPMLISSPSC
jgi:hypothetical protein